MKSTAEIYKHLLNGGVIKYTGSELIVKLDEKSGGLISKRTTHSDPWQNTSWALSDFSNWEPYEEPKAKTTVTLKRYWYKFPSGVISHTENTKEWKELGYQSTTVLLETEILATKQFDL